MDEELIKAILSYEDACKNIISLVQKHYRDTHRVCHIDAAGYVVLPIEQNPSSAIRKEFCQPTTFDAWIAFALGQLQRHYQDRIHHQQDQSGNAQRD